MLVYVQSVDRFCSRTNYLAPEDRENVSLPDILSYILSDNFFICFKRFRIDLTHFCGNFESDVYKLSKVLIILRATLFVP